MDIIDMESYNAGYASGYVDGQADKQDAAYVTGYAECLLRRRKKARIRKQQRKEMMKHCLYFLKQKLMGVFLLVLTFWGVGVMKADPGIAFITIPLGLLFLCGKERLFEEGGEHA